MLRKSGFNSARRSRNSIWMGDVSHSLAKSIEPLENRALLTISFQFDYSRDDNGFFDEQLRRDLLELAGTMVGSLFEDNLSEIDQNTFGTGGNNWTARFTNPSTAAQDSVDGLIVPEDTLYIFAGARGISSLGSGGPGGFSASGTADWLDNVNFRGQDGEIDNPSTDFGPWGGQVTFKLSADWFFSATTEGLASPQSDFLSVAVHELAHVVGFGTADSFSDQINSGEFIGPAAVAEFDEAGNPTLDGDLSHWTSGLMDEGQETAMDPALTNGERKLLTPLDIAAIEDIGWEIVDLSIHTITVANGSDHTIVIEDDGDPNNNLSQVTIDGTNVSTFINPSTMLVINGADGNDVITISGVDSLFDAAIMIVAGAGDDAVTVDHTISDDVTLDAGAGSDLLQVNGAAVTVVTHTFTNSSDGIIVLSDTSAATIAYTGLEPITDNVSATDRVFNFGASADDVSLSDDATMNNDISTLSSVSTSETVSFLSPTNSLTINTSDGNDTVTLNGLDSLFAGTVVINTDDDDDRVDASGFNQSVVVAGGAGADSLTGSGFADVILGGEGNDTIPITAGNDSLDGQDGTDLIVATGDTDYTLSDTQLASSSTDSLTSIEQADLTAGSGDNTIDASTFSGSTTLQGESGDDTITGGSANDLIMGGAGDDVLDGAAGDDNIFGSSGQDMLTGSLGDDAIFGEADDDILVETGDVDLTLTDSTLTGIGTDSISGIESALLTGGASPNAIDAQGFSSNVTIMGLDGNDTLTGGSAADTLMGGLGDDRLKGKGGGDNIDGNEGNDTMFGGGGNDTLVGGAGDDSFLGQGSTDRIIESGDVDFTMSNTQLTGIGIDAINSIEEAVLTSGASVNTLDTRDFDGSVTLDGGIGDDTLRSGSAADVLLGQAGDDLLAGGGGDDVLLGADGADSLFGGGGDDTLTGDIGDDNLKGQGGTDLLLESADTDLTLTDTEFLGLGTDSVGTLERAQLTGGAGNNTLDATGFSGDVTLVGDAGDDSLLGGTGDDSLDGGLNNDFISGKAGDDTIDGGKGSDKIFGSGGDDLITPGNANDTVSGQGGSDTIIASANKDFILTDAQLTGQGTDKLTSVEAVQITAGSKDNTLDTSGFSGNVTLDGAGGNDTIVGGAGNDSIEGGDGDDTIRGGLGNDTIKGGDGNDTLNGGDGNDVLRGNDGNDGLSGFTGNDLMVGSSGTDTLIGGDGDDTLMGGADIDIALGDDGDDSINGGAEIDTLAGGNGTDTIVGSMEEIDEGFTFFADWVNAV